MNKKANAQKNTFLKNAQANAESIFFKRVFFSPPKNLPFLFLQIYFSQRTGFVGSRTDIASNVNRFKHIVCRPDTSPLRTDRRASANSTFAIGGVSCSADTFVVTESSVLRMNICAENPAHRKSANR